MASFAHNRGIDVRSTAKSSKEPTKRDYVEAFKAADASFNFRFLDLPPELRTNIYKELLILQNSFTCWPQILATCNSINEEASNVLYGDNLLEVKIYQDGVYVHGEKCGSYSTDEYGRYTAIRYKKKEVDQVIEWPQFLRRAQFLQLSVVNYQCQAARWNIHLSPSTGPICYIINSLCSFLHEGGKLRLFELQLRKLTAEIEHKRASQQLQEALPTILAPLRYLSTIKRLHINGVQVEMNRILKPSSITTDVARKINSGYTVPLMDSIRLAQRTRLMIQGDLFDDDVNMVMTRYRYEDALPTELPLSGILNSDKMLQRFFGAMKSLHAAWDEHYRYGPSNECRKQVAELVRLEIEVKILMRDNAAND